MGIKFHCQACSKKLHVKSFLAGKRGVCPYCGSSVHIPAESSRGKGAKSPAEDGSAIMVTTGGPAAEVGSQVPIAQGSPPVSVAATGAVGPSAQGVPGFAPAPIQPAASSGAPFTSPTAPLVTAAPVAAPAGVPLAAPVRPDPIAEAPQSVWYVQPPSGGRYGPANGEVMRRWIQQGRVSADSLVWREGWADWKLAGVVFSELSGGGPPAAAPPGPTPTPAVTSPIATIAPAGSTRRAVNRRTRRRSNSTVLATVITLCVLTVALMVALIYVLRG